MKKIIKVLTILLIGAMLMGCDILNNPTELDTPTITEVVYVGPKDDKSEYLMYFSDGSSQKFLIDDDKELDELTTITKLVYLSINDGIKEYLMYFSDGSSKIVTVEDDSNPIINEITINDLYEAAKTDGFTGSLSDFIKEYLNLEVEDSKYAVNEGLKSSVSIFAHYTKTEIKVPIVGPVTEEVKEYSSAGSGVIYKLDKQAGNAYIVTNHHVVYDSNSETQNKISDDIEVYLYGMELEDYAIKATYIGGSETNDLAVLKIENSEVIKNSLVQALKVADSELVKPGDTAFAIGNAQARGISVTKGIVSVENEHITMDTNDLGLVTFRVIRIDTAVNSGNSGGGLFNSKGEIIGIVNAKTIADTIDGIGYALPSNTVFNLADSIIHYTDNNLEENAYKVLIGVTMKIKGRVTSYDEIKEEIILKDIIKVEAISEDTPASLHFILDDEIVSVTFLGIIYEITRLHQMADILFKVKKNDTVTFTVLRDGEIVNLDITFTEENFNKIV